MARITIVNEYPEFLELMTTIHQMDGHEVIGFDSSNATLDALLETSPDLLIVDLETAAAIAPAALRRTPLIVCSGDIPALHALADQIGDPSRVHVLEKPFSLDKLAITVHRALGAPLSTVA